MIKLKDILKEIDIRKEDSFSWLDPMGNFHPIENTHADSAGRFSKNIDDPLSDLLKKGWQRIRHDTADMPESNVLYTFNDIHPPNNIQIRKLVDMCIELGFFKLEYDRGYDYDGTPTKLLWSANNTL